MAIFGIEIQFFCLSFSLHYGRLRTVRGVANQEKETENISMTSSLCRDNLEERQQGHIVCMLHQFTH
jgi:hypothetical protein